MSIQNLWSADDSLTDEEVNVNLTYATYGAPPQKPPDGGGGGGDSGGGSEDTVTLTGVLQVSSGTKTYDGGEEGKTLSSTTSDENVVLVQSSATLTISNYTLSKTGDCSNADNSNFYAVNAVVAAKSAATVYIDNCELNSKAEGANGLFASGEGSTIYAYNCTITSTENSSRGLDATYEGTVIASKLTINTSGDHCAALATDRGDGYISVTDSTLATAGQGSPLIYSTGIIEVDNVTGTSTGSQVAGIEGLSTIRIKNSNLSGSGKKASEPVANGVIIYQSMSGDSTEGTATFEVADSTLKSAINSGAMFYITNTSAVITVQNTVLDFDSANNYLLKAAGNDGSNGWGTAGSNGAEVVFTAIDQTLSGVVSVDGISYLDMYLVNSTYTGTFELDTTYTGKGGTDLFISADSTWTVTKSCTLQTLTVASGASIVDSSGKTVSIVNSSGKTLVSGTSSITVTVTTYTSKSVEAAYTINDFEIDRSAFEEMYAEDEPETDYDDRIVIAGTSTNQNSYTLQEGKTYTAAQYEGNGGAVYVESYGTVTGKNVTFKNNSVAINDENEDENQGQGGAIYTGSNSELNITDSVFSGNKTVGLKGHGGAIYNSSVAEITDTAFSDNSATMGGAIFNNGGSLEITGGTVCSNSAKYGGAIQNFRGGTVNITSTKFSGNSAAADGGAIAHNSGSATITGATFSGNTARSSGGAIWNTSALTLADVTFSGNSAKSGGAIYNTGTVNMTGSVTVETESDDFYNTGTLNWDLTGGTASYGSFEGYQYLTNDGGTLTITLDGNQKFGSYTIATGNLSDSDGKETFTLTGIEGQSTITINGESVIYDGKKYTLATNDNGTTKDLTDDKLILTVGQFSTTTITNCSTDGNMTVVSWISPSESEVVDIALASADSEDEKLLIRIEGKSIELYSVPESYELSLKDAESSTWSETTQISETSTGTATAVVSNENDVADLFFAEASDTWNARYQARHTGNISSWSGTGECVSLVGKNKIANTFTGSSDANILVLTDDANGDALFVDDIYTAFPAEQKARFAQIDEIRAGAGDDVVDMTSQRFVYDGGGIIIRGGSGDDTIWANKGSNQLFGDAGDDRIVGASGNDVITGGSGNDSMHGGGGSDVFCFCDNWGTDTVEQLAGGTVTLWFASGSESNWDQENMTYTDGTNSVKVTGVSEVTLKFGDNGSDQFDALSAAGCFMEESSDKIFEKEQNGVLAVV